MSKTARDLFDDEIEVLGKDEWKSVIPVWMILILDANPDLYSGWRERIEFLYFYVSVECAVDMDLYLSPEYARMISFDYPTRSCISRIVARGQIPLTAAGQGVSDVFLPVHVQ